MAKTPKETKGMREAEAGQESAAPVCAARTKAGDACRNHPLEGSLYCRVHQSQAQVDSVLGASRGDVDGVTAQAADELNAMAADLEQKSGYKPPPFSPAALAALLKSSASKFAAWLPTELVRDIVRGLEGTKKEDLLDPETWKGLWYILNYSIVHNTQAVLEEAGKRLSFIPGMDLMVQFTQSVVESPRDLFSVDTWKGAFMILTAAVEANATNVKRKVLGGGEEEA